MGKSGHFSRSLMLLTTDISLNGVEDCNSVNPILMNIRSIEHLKRLSGRWYKSPTRIGKMYQVLDVKDTHLLGKDILMRSPVTCACQDGICNTCYGELYLINKDINSIGGFASARITEPITQNILSTKHLLTTTSKMIKFRDSFYNFFNVNSNEIALSEETEDINFADYSLILLNDNIITIDEFIEDREYNRFTTIFHIKNNKTGEIEEFREEDELDLYMSKEMSEVLDTIKLDIIDEENHKAYEINLGKLETGVPLFIIEVQNKELTKPLYDIMDLLNKDTHRGCETVEEMAQLLLDLLITSKIDATSVHGELLLRPLIRNSRDILKFPNWGRYCSTSDYNVLTITKALLTHPSVTTSLSFQDLGRQLLNPLTFRKSAPSFIDSFYRERP
jgi:hypothetical protein